MPSNQHDEEVYYRFVGDATELVKATKASMKMLDQYGKALKSVGEFTPEVSSKGLKQLSSVIRQTLDPATKLTQVFKQLHKELDSPLYKGPSKSESIDRQIAQWEKGVKSAKESFSAINQLEKAKYAAQLKRKKTLEAIKSKDHGKITRSERIDQQIAQWEKQTKSARESFSAINQLEKARYNARLKREKTLEAIKSKNHGKITDSERIDQQIAQLEKQAKSAKESFLWIQKLEAEQNKYNSSIKGSIYTRRSTGTESARDAAAALLAEEQKFTQARDTMFGGVFKKFNDIQKLFSHKDMFADSSSKINKLAASLVPVANKLTLVAKATKAAVTGFKQLYTTGLRIQKLFLKLSLGPLALFGKTLYNVGKRMRDTASISKKLGGLKSIIGIGSGLAFGKLISDAMKNASDMAESINLFQTAMKDSIGTGNKFIQHISEMGGLDATKLMDITGLFYEMAYAIEMPQDAAAKMSADLTTLTADIASLFNKDIDSVADNLTSGLRGMSRAVVKYGMDIRATTLETYAASKLGIKKQFETMSEADREILRYLVMLDQASDAQGDFAQTITQPANQLKIFKEQILGVSRAIGRFIVDFLEPALPVINGFAMAMRLVITYIADALSIWDGLTGRTKKKETADAADNVAQSIGGIGAAADKTKKKVKDLLAPLDELNILSEKTSDAQQSGLGTGIEAYGTVDPKLLEALKNAKANFGEIEMPAHDLRDKILKFLGFEYLYDPASGIYGELRKIPGGFADQLSQAFAKSDFSTVGALIAEKMNEVITQLPAKLSWENLGPGIVEHMGHFITALNSFIRTLDWESVGATIGEAIKTAIRAINFVGMRFDWKAFGNALGTSLTSFMKNADLEVAGTAIANWLNGITQFAAEFNQTFDWTELGLTLSRTLNNFILHWDIVSSGKAIADWINKLAHFAATFGYTFNWTALGQKLADTINNFFKTWDVEKLADAATSICKGLKETITQFLDSVNWTTVGEKLAQLMTALDWPSLLSDLASVIFKAFWSLVKLKFAYISERQQDNPLYQHPDTPDKPGKPKGGRTTGSIFDYPHVPMATGGVVTEPTRAIIGEAGRSEAVIPLDNSPQMKAFAQQLANQVNNDKVVAAIYNLIDAVNSKDLQVNIGDDAVGRSYDRYNQQRGLRLDSGIFSNAY